MPLPQNGAPMYQALREELQRFKHASAEQQKGMLNVARETLISLGSDIKDQEAGIDALTKLSFAAQLINYANVLRNMHNSGYFDILIDFKMPKIFERPEFVELAQYFEFHATAPQMKVKVPLDQVPISVWKLFREAQIVHLKETNKSHLFRFELDIENPPKDQLYPIPIQMFGVYDNEAVDRAYGDEDGIYAFANPFGVFLLPGGGMVEIAPKDGALILETAKTIDKILKKMLEEHLQEQWANAWWAAGEHYMEIDQFDLMHCLREVTIENSKLKAAWRDALKVALQVSGEGTTNKNIMADVVATVDNLLDPILAQIAVIQAQIDPVQKAIDAIDATDPAKKEELAGLKARLDPLSKQKSPLDNDKQALNVLRADVQVEPLKLTTLWNNAVKFIKKYADLANIEQLLDTRGCGGKQMSHAFLMEKDLLLFFKEAFNNAEPELGDDIRFSKLGRMTLLQALEKYNLVKFSHLLIVLASDVNYYEKGLRDFYKIWDNNQFCKSRDSICKGATAAIAAIDAVEAAKGAAVDPRPAAAAGGGMLAAQFGFMTPPRMATDNDKGQESVATKKF